MIYLLFTILLIMTVASYYINRNIIMPSFVQLLSFLLVSFVYVICSGVVTDDISIDTLLIIICSLIAFSLGEVIIIAIRNKGKIYSACIIDKPVEFKMMIINTPLVATLAVIILISAYIRLSAFCQAAGISVSISSFFSSFATIRFYATHGLSPTLPGWVNLISIIGPCIIRVCITVSTYNYMKYRIFHKRYIMVFVAYLAYLITLTSRTVFLDIIAYFIFQFCFLRLFVLGKQPKIKREVLKPLIFALVVFAFVFIVIGNVAEKNGTVLLTLFAYSAAGIVGLNQFLANPYYSPGILHSRTIAGLISPLDNFGVVLPKIEEFLPHYYYLNGSQTSNEYTCLMEPIYDFGISGMFLTRFLLGAIVAVVYFYILSKSKNIQKYFVIPIFVPIYYALIIAGIDDQFSTFIGVYFIAQMLVTWIIWKVFIKYKELNEFEKNGFSVHRK